MVGEAVKAGVEIWPQHWHAWQVFTAMRSQWRAMVGGMGGIIWQGLEYASLPIVLAEHRKTEHRQPLDVLMPQLRVLEHAAQAEMNGDD